MRDFFLPTKNNNYQPKLLQKTALYVYLVMLLVVNLSFDFLIPSTVRADININLLYQYHNEERNKRGLSDLAINTQLVTSATNKAKAMLASNCWAHYCPDGKSPWEFFDEAGYLYVYAGENLAEGYTDTNKVIQAWMNSQTHRENILNPKFNEIGIGYAVGNYQNNDNNMIIVVHFGNRKENSSLTATPEVKNDNNFIRFNTPNDDQVINLKTPVIQGKVNEGVYLKLFLNADLLTTLTLNSTTFTYAFNNELSDGRYTLYAVVYDKNNKQLGSSRTMNFDIDTTVPKVDSEDIQITSLDIDSDLTEINLTINNSDVYYFSEKTSGTTATRNTNNDLQIKLDSKILTENSELFFVLGDKAGNKTQITVNTADLLDQLENQQNQYQASLLNTQQSQINLAQIKTTFNWGFLTFLGTIFGLDYTILKKTGFTNLNKSKSHLNFTVLAVLFIILVVSLSSGNILNGIKP